MEEVAIEGMGTMGPDAGGIMAIIAGAGVGATIVSLAISLVMLIACWKIFSKAGEPGWAVLIPIYNTIVFLKVAGKPLWWIVLLFIPVVNLVVSILALVGLAKNFGKGGGTVAGLLFLPIIFYPILGFGGAEYVGAGEAEVAVE